MGNPPDVGPTVTQTDYEYTSTKSAFTMEVDGKVLMKITFLSPLTPNDYVRQSLIFSYMEVEVWSMDGGSHNVQLYTDISAGKFGATALGRVFAHSSDRMGVGRSQCRRTVGLWHIRRRILP